MPRHLVMSDSAARWTAACQAPFQWGFSRQEYQNGLPCPSPGDLLAPGMEAASLTSPALAGRIFTTRAPWEATDDKKKWLRKSSRYSLPTDIYQPLASELHIPPHPSDARTIGRYRFDPWVGKISWRKHGNPIQYSCLDNSGDRRIWWATVHGVAKSQIQLKWLSRHTQASFLSTHPKKQSHFNHIEIWWLPNHFNPKYLS